MVIEIRPGEISMSNALTLYTNPMSRGRIARWMLEEVGESYDTKVIEYGDAMKSDDYRAINPMGKVPAVRHGDRIVTECSAICAYLADAFPDAGLAPDPSARHDYYRWMFFAAGPMEAAVTNKALGFNTTADQAKSAGYGDFDTVMDAMEYAVTQRKYVASDRFTAADVYFGSHIGWGLQFKSIEERPAFVDYWQRISDREEYRRANRLDDADMPK